MHNPIFVALLFWLEEEEVWTVQLNSAVDQCAQPPVGDMATFGILRMLDVEKMQMKLDERIGKVLYFKEDDIWFEAKPVILYLEYNSTHVTQTLSIVREKNKKNSKEPLDAKGQPKWVDLSGRSTPGYHDLKALYISTSTSPGCTR